MASWKDSIVIGATVGTVFDYVDEPMNLVDWLPGMVEVRNVIGTGAGREHDWTYKMAGMLQRGQTVTVEHVPNKCAVHQTIGAVGSTFAYFVEPYDQGTTLTLKIEYSIPIPILGRLAERIVLRRNTREFELALTNVKETLEG